MSASTIVRLPSRPPAPKTGPIPRLTGQEHTQSYTALAQQIRREGLQGRRLGFYGLVVGCLVLALGGAITGFILLQHSWLQLLMAGALGLIFTQFAFLGHEASHRQIFRSGPANDLAGRFLANGVVGISYSWWMSKHTRHHANPNKLGKDPDIEMDTISFVEESASTRSGVMGWFTRRQGTLFFPLLMLEGINLHRASIASLLTRRPDRERLLELGVLALRIGGYLAILFWVLPVGLAFAFLGVQLAVFGLYMGASFAPNHKGMPIVPPTLKLDFLSKQVRTSRNIRGGWWATALMGGLNYQIEHHLFPSMPRPNLARARILVRTYCAEHHVPYTETSLAQSYAIVIRYLNQVGLSARDPFDCPLASQLRPR